MYRPFEEFRPFEKCISVIGSGGKTTLLRYLSGLLPGTVILTTSTHMYPFPGIPLVNTCEKDTGKGRDRFLTEIREALSCSRVVCVGSLESSGKLASPAGNIPFELLLPEADHILIEADGAAGRPLKAHRPWEPVIPACSGLTVCVVGASGIGRPVSQACHCPDLFASLAGIPADCPAEPEHIAAVINRENLADCCLVNQADTQPDTGPGLRLCDCISRAAFPCWLAP